MLLLISLIFSSFVLLSIELNRCKILLHFLSIKVRERDFGQLATNLPWQFFDALITFKMAAFINFEAVTSSNF